MSEEEKKAIEYIEQFIGIEKQYKYKPIKIKTLTNTRPAITTILNLIEKQQKEIEELENENKEIIDYSYKNDSLLDLYNKEKEKNKELENKRKTTMEVIGANYIHKDKIREKIKELKEPREITLIDEKGNSKKVMYEEIYNDTIKILEDLLESD